MPSAVKKRDRDKSEWVVISSRYPIMVSVGGGDETNNGDWGTVGRKSVLHESVVMCRMTITAMQWGDAEVELSVNCPRRDTIKRHWRDSTETHVGM